MRTFAHTDSSHPLVSAGAEARGDTPTRLSRPVPHVAEDIASVTVRTVVYDEYLQLVQTHDGWKIANAL